jgi:hypothetical protein
MVKNLALVYKNKVFLFLIILIPFFSVNEGYGQNIPFLTNAIQVTPTSYAVVVKTLNKMGYKISSEDKTKQSVRTDFKLLPGTICHISIYVAVKDSCAMITAKWWSEIAPPEGLKNIMIVCHVDSQMDNLFQELEKYAKALKGNRINYSITEKNKLF